MSDSPRSVLILCTSNSARSILAEALVNKLGEGRFCGYSAGSHPLPRPHPLAIETLERHGHSVADLRSKSWDEFAAPGAPRMDFVFTMCDNAAGEICPLWPGSPVSAHWGMPDPAAVEGNGEEKRAAFELAYASLHARVSRFVDLPFETLDADALQKALVYIGRMKTSGG